MASLLLRVRLRPLMLLALALVPRPPRPQEEEEALRRKVPTRRLQAIVQRTEMSFLQVLQLREWALWLFYCKGALRRRREVFHRVCFLVVVGSEIRDLFFFFFFLLCPMERLEGEVENVIR